MNPIVQTAVFYVKHAASINPDVLSALQGGVAGAGAGALVQAVRRLFQSKRDEEENGAPSILNGMLMGGGLGAAGGFGLNRLLQHMATQDAGKRHQLNESSVQSHMDHRPTDAVWAQHKAPYEGMSPQVDLTRASHQGSGHPLLDAGERLLMNPRQAPDQVSQMRKFLQSQGALQPHAFGLGDAPAPTGVQSLPPYMEAHQVPPLGAHPALATPS